MSSHPKIHRTQPNEPAKDLLIVLYGSGGIGKTTTACQAPSPLVLDCAGGVRFQSVDQWKIGSARDLAEALAYLKTVLTPPAVNYQLAHTPANGYVANGQSATTRDSINGHAANSNPNTAACPYRTVVLN